tara:strand:+ start:3393 stop:4172 length:780 start_codon:yes stop_codon:yes gene_type:complete
MAAGKGERMNLNYPKPLLEIDYPNGQKSIIINLLNVIEKAISNIVSINIVINSLDKHYFEQIERLNKKINLIQLDSEQIQGTAVCLDAVKNDLALEHDTILLWGDLALIPSSYIFFSTILYEKFNPLIAMPTRYKKNPYVGFLRDNEGKYSDVFHSNEGKPYSGWAEQDCLCFILDSKVFPLLSDFIANKNFQNKKEIDFVKLIPFCNTKRNNVIGFPFGEYECVSGINNQKKVDILQDYLKDLSQKEYEDKFLNRYNF